MIGKGTWIIFKKEMKGYFTSPLVYILAGIFSVITGWIFYNYCILATNQQSPSVEASVIIPTFGIMNTLLMFMTPFLTMRLFAEEKKLHTIELLFTSPIKDLDMICGKFMACLFVCFFMLTLTLIFPVILDMSGLARWGLVSSSYFGLIVIASSYVAVGVFASSLTQNQVISAILSFSIIFSITLIVLASNSIENPLVNQMINYLSFAFHLEGFARGVVKSYSFVYHLSFLSFFFFMTNKVLDSRNW